MPYTSATPRQFSAVMNFLNIEINGDPSSEDNALYSWIDTVIDTCYVEAESYCGQPLRSGTVTYQFYAHKATRAEDSNIFWKYVPYAANTALTNLEYRDNEFDTYTNYDNTKYTWSVEPHLNFIVFRDAEQGQFRATLTTGFTDNAMPNTILQGISEMVALLYRQSPQGGNWFGLNSVASGGAGQNVSQSLKIDIGWQKYFSLYFIPAV